MLFLIVGVDCVVVGGVVVGGVVGGGVVVVGGGVSGVTGAVDCHRVSNGDLLACICSTTF